MAQRVEHACLLVMWFTTLRSLVQIPLCTHLFCGHLVKISPSPAVVGLYSDINNSTWLLNCLEFSPLGLHLDSTQTPLGFLLGLWVGLHSDSTRTTGNSLGLLGLHSDSNGIPLGLWPVPVVRSDSEWSPIGQVGECKVLWFCTANEECADGGRGGLT